MKATLSISDGISPRVDSMIRKLDGPGRKEMLQVIGEAMRNWSMEAFTNPAMRPAVWPVKTDGTPSTLQGQGMPVLRRSIQVESSSSEVVIGSDRPYALIHQVGGTIRPKTAGALRFKIGDRWIIAKKVEIPARPYLPVLESGAIMAAAAEDAAEAVIGQMTEGT